MYVIEIFFNHNVDSFFEKSILEEVHILLYLHNNSTMLIPQMKLFYIMLGKFA